MTLATLLGALHPRRVDLHLRKRDGGDECGDVLAQRHLRGSLLRQRDDRSEGLGGPDGGGASGAAASLVVVAYRKATISLADEVVHLDEGRIVGRGTHAELLATSPAYAHLVNAYEVKAEVGAGPDTHRDAGADAEETAR